MVPLPPNQRFQFTSDISICRVLHGLWQVSGSHGAIVPQEAITSMFDYGDAGFTTWDAADTYGPAEDLLGEFLNERLAIRGKPSLGDIQVFTKWMPRPGSMPRRVVEAQVDRARRRLGVESLDLLQLHWADYTDQGYVEALKHLVVLKREGFIKHLGVTNFDTDHLCFLLDQGIPLVSNQIQFSILDQRPLIKLLPFCKAHDVRILAYGTLCGGFLSERYLGQPEPTDWDIQTASQRKYKRMIETWGGWGLFQELLQAAAAIARKHQVSIANVAMRAILDQPAVAGIIVGARLGLSEHLEDTQQVFGFRLDPEDFETLGTVQRRSRDLYRLIGDCGDEFRF
jgi:aryl-alcohol dehydrogenase-like predicted oxidoreductase